MAYALCRCDGHLAGLAKVKGFRAYVKKTMDDFAIKGSIERVDYAWDPHQMLLYVQCSETDQDRVHNFLIGMMESKMMGSIFGMKLKNDILSFEEFTINKSGSDIKRGYESDSDNDGNEELSSESSQDSSRNTLSTDATMVTGMSHEKSSACFRIFRAHICKANSWIQDLPHLQPSWQCELADQMDSGFTACFLCGHGGEHASGIGIG